MWSCSLPFESRAEAETKACRYLSCQATSGFEGHSPQTTTCCPSESLIPSLLRRGLVPSYPCSLPLPFRITQRKKPPDDPRHTSGEGLGPEPPPASRQGESRLELAGSWTTAGMGVVFSCLVAAAIVLGAIVRWLRRGAPGEAAPEAALEAGAETEVLITTQNTGRMQSLSARTLKYILRYACVSPGH